MKLIDQRTSYFTRVADIAHEIQKETNQAEGKKDTDMILALEVARLQTEIADLKEHNIELKVLFNRMSDKLDTALNWAEAWKRAATKWRAQTHKLDICLDHTIVGNEDIFTSLREERDNALKWAKTWKLAATVNWRARISLRGLNLKYQQEKAQVFRGKNSRIIELVNACQRARKYFSQVAFLTDNQKQIVHMLNEVLK